MVRKNYVALVIDGLNLSSRKRSHSTQSDSEWIEKNILILPQIHSGILKLKCEYPQAPSMFTSEKFDFGFLRATRKQEEKLNELLFLGNDGNSFQLRWFQNYESSLHSWISSSQFPVLSFLFYLLKQKPMTIKAGETYLIIYANPLCFQRYMCTFLLNQVQPLLVEGKLKTD